MAAPGRGRGRPFKQWSMSNRLFIETGGSRGPRAGLAVDRGDPARGIRGGTEKKTGRAQRGLSGERVGRRCCQRGVVGEDVAAAPAEFGWLDWSPSLNSVASGRAGVWAGPGAERPGIRRSLATMLQLTRIDRVRGCLLGLAVGD